ncbi:MAG: TIGR03984 family CRISPR-associated protein [Dolichospermum sp. DEX189]|uniref:TIGR03984 family CRISPR-associated protein n=1 Tax=Aphanizomenon flos-aquae FACHB-1040 TaxID=2692887 RepID=A0ABR8C060_APHFL|nr:CRISPR-associated protein Csx19 [Aphanizomenon flos-aquae]MBD2279397.1 TIGR03984 family CRISPR-associated protein [Aphanizomenon flos-aquae FACHB-1040]MBO1072392.1 TIGR03984 family CRISPR-associated protein [Dolichospermum sp. DEX189]MDK2408873.1 CRISPR-associated protein Csx19 [Aphanizomenon sp. 202]MDK2459821.1 CRISPR-associated protein Csx19 [Aphanizomenon sp. PH219]
MTLYGRCTTTNITLKSALSNCTTALSEAVAIIYSPTSCQLAKVDQNGDLTNAKNEMISLDNVFELRAFNQNYELRWLNESNGKGKAVLISEQNISDYLYADISEIKELHKNPQQYILWGEKASTESTSGWAKLSTARIGSIDVPIKGLTGGDKRVYLNAIEYLQADEQYGNVSVVEERLTKLEVK